MDTIHVSNLPAGLDESMVTQFFSIYGTVTSCSIPSPTSSGTTTAIVRLSSAKEAKEIIDTLNDTVPAGLAQPLKIAFHIETVAAPAPPPPPPPPPPAAPLPAAGNWDAAPSAPSFGKSNNGSSVQRPGPWENAKGGVAGVDDGGWGEPTISDNVYVQGLPAGTSEESAMQTFSEFGKVLSIKLMSRGPDVPCAALIRFEGTEAARLVKDILNGAKPDGFPVPLVVKYANQPLNKGEKAAGKGGWQTVATPQAGAWQKGAAWGSIPPAPPPPVAPSNDKGNDKGHDKGADKGKGKGKVSVPIETLVELVYESGALPGGKIFHDEATAVRCAGLPGDTTEWHLYKMFAPFGAIHTLSVQGDGSTWAVGFINFLEIPSAEAACIAYNGMEMPNGDLMKASIKAKAP